MAKEIWDIDVAHSSVNFSVRHMVISKVKGRFTKFSAAITTDFDDPTASSVSARIEAASVDTHEPQRDNHLRSADFFEVEKFPALTFESKKIAKAGAEKYEVTGDLTIHGVTKPVALEVEYLGRTKDPWGGERVGFTAKTAIDRRDYGLTYNAALETGGLVVGHDVAIELEVEAVRRKG